MKKTAPLPLIDGIKPSYLHLPCDKKLHGTLLLDFLCRRFPYIGREIWAGRLSDGHIFDEAGTPLAAQSFPHAEKAADEVLSLPMYPDIDHALQAQIIDHLVAAVDSTL